MAGRKSKAVAKTPTHGLVTSKSAGDSWIRMDSRSWSSVGEALIGRVNEARALCQSAVMPAIDVIAQDISKTRLRLCQGYGDERRTVKADEHLLARRLALRPNVHHVWREFSALVVAHLVFRQNAYILRQRRNIADTNPDLMPLTTRHVNLLQYDGTFFYDVVAEDQGQATLFGFNNKRLTLDDLIHIRLRQWDGYKGLSTLLIGESIFGISQMITEFQAALTKNGTRPGSVISVPGVFDDAQFTRLKNDLTEAYTRASQSGRPLILEQGATVSKLSFNAAEMDLVRAKVQIQQEVARLLRMPPHKIGLLESVKAENLAQIEQAYVDDTLIPVAGSIEDALTAALLTEDEQLQGFYLQFDRHELYNRDPAMAAARVIEAYKAGLITRRQAVTRLGYGEVDAKLDTFSIPVNTAILHRDGRLEFVTPNKDQPGDVPAPTN